MIWLIAAPFLWVALSLTATFLTNPITWYSLMSHGHFPQVTRFVPVPCFVAIVDYWEKRAEDERHWNSPKLLSFRLWMEKLFLFSLPERIQFLRMSRVCGSSSAENAEKYEPFHIHTRWLEGSPQKARHRCHEITGAVPTIQRVSMFLDIMGYDNIVNLFEDKETYSKPSKRGEGRTRMLVNNCRNFEEADAISMILQRQVDGHDDLDPARQYIQDDWSKRESLWNVKCEVLSRENIVPLVKKFEKRIDAHPEVPLDIHLALYQDAKEEAS